MASPSLSPNRPSRWGPATRSLASFAMPDPTPILLSSRLPSSYARAQLFKDFKHPDRIVVGSEDERARKIMAEIYRPLYLNRTPILYSSRRSAELIKYGANTFPATKVAFLWPFSLTR